MKIMSWSRDGGPESKVAGLFFIESKNLFSIALLRFERGSREAYHSHAFNAVSWVLRGHLLERLLSQSWNSYMPSFVPIFTARDTTHRVYGMADTTWVLTFRGPWSSTWIEHVDGQKITLTNGRVVV